MVGWLRLMCYEVNVDDVIVVVTTLLAEEINASVE